MNGYEMNIWRRATYDECQKIDDFAKKALKKKIENAWIIGGVAAFCISMLSFGVGITSVEGESQAHVGWIMFFIGIVIVVALSVLYVKYFQKKISAINEQKFEVIDGLVVDRDVVKNKNGTYHHVTVKGDSDADFKEQRLCVHQSVYDKSKLGTEVLIIRYDQDSYEDGFFDEYDVVVK